MRGTYHVERVNLILLDRAQELPHLKLGQDYNLVSTVRTGMAEDNQRINMALRQQTERDVRVGLTRARLLFSERPFVLRDLHGVGNNITMGDLDSFLFNKLALQRPRITLQTTHTGKPEVPLE